MTAPGTEVRIREGVPADEPLLWRMLTIAAGPVDGPAAEPSLSAYVEGWGRPGDAGTVAQADGQAVGAAWYRRFTEAAPGYGFVAADLPELSLAVESAWRGRGIGRALLEALIERARREATALSLSVSADNERAIGLYHSIGFEVVGGDAGHPTMLLRLVG